MKSGYTVGMNYGILQSYGISLQTESVWMPKIMGYYRLWVVTEMVMTESTVPRCTRYDTGYVPGTSLIHMDKPLPFVWHI
jgi:hypothetical protein